MEAHHVSGLAVHERLDGDKHQQPVAAWLGFGLGLGLGSPALAAHVVSVDDHGAGAARKLEEEVEVEEVEVEPWISTGGPQGVVMWVPGMASKRR